MHRTLSRWTAKEPSGTHQLCGLQAFAYASSPQQQEHQRRIPPKQRTCAMDNQTGASPRMGQVWLRGLLVSLVALGALTIVLEASSLLVHSSTQVNSARLHRVVALSTSWHHDGSNTNETLTNIPSGDFLPKLDAWDDLDEVPADDLLHLSLLHEACVTDVNAVLPWTFGSPLGDHQWSNGSASNPEVLVHPNDTQLLEKLRECPDVDIFLPQHLRGNGYCEDAVAYAKYLNSRLLPVWAMEVKLFDPQLGREVDYFDLCPHTPVIFFNHYWDDVPASPRWPSHKPLYLMPNIEMIELTAEHYWRADAVLCKTRVCEDRVTRWYAQEGNPRDAKVFYTKHTSSDQASFARRRLGDAAIAPKDFANVSFLHTAGTSIWKGTRELLDCWTSTAGLPPLDVYIGESAFNYLFPPFYQRKIENSRSPIKIELGMLEPLAFSKLTAEAAFFVCPSRSEGYGHYLNQARASGGLIVTTDAHPMNELITSSDMGVLVHARSKKDPDMLLGGGYTDNHGLKDAEGLLAVYSSYSLCSAVRDMVETTSVEQRAAMGSRARRQYHEDTLFFARAMQELRQFARTHAWSDANLRGQP